MEIDTEYKHLAAFQMKLAQEVQQKKQDRELVELFGIIYDEIYDDEEEQIWNLENLNRVK